MRCEDLMSSPVETASEIESIAAVARRMRDGHLGFMPVCDARGRAIGVVTDRDIVVRAFAENASDAPVRTIMTPELLSCAPEDAVERAEALMREHRASRVVVVESGGRAVGVISVADLALLDESEATATLRAVIARDVHEARRGPGEPPRWGQHQTLLRRRMVERIAARGVTDRAVLRALLAVPRELFLPPDQAAHAYEDRDVELEGGRSIPSPHRVALMAAALHPQAGERLLQLGAGSGYATVVFACLAGSVTAVEPDAELAEGTAHRLRALGLTNVRLQHGSSAGGTYDAIAVLTPDAAIPASLLEQLAVGGRLVASVGPVLVRLTRTGADAYRRDVIEVPEVEP